MHQQTVIKHNFIFCMFTAFTFSSIIPAAPKLAITPSPLGHFRTTLWAGWNPSLAVRIDANLEALNASHL